MKTLWISLFAAVGVTLSVAAAPIPATSSSFVISSNIGKFISNHGFSIHADKTDWIHSPPPGNNPFIATLYRSPTTEMGVQPALTVRIDELDQEQPLKKYVKKWMKDYPRFGFEILKAKPVKINDQKAFLLDLVNRQTAKQLRQVVFLKQKKAVILTCRGHYKSFSNTVGTCNNIIANFRWNM
ncbi:MAG: hypothetical protein IT288_15190 [Bdellovibrionales bacterium]|nr:hypothetical protein [Bdellovibrionales bacterium]